MQSPSADGKPKITLDVHQYRLTPVAEQMLRRTLDALTPQVEHFPVADLRVLIAGNARNNDVSIKLTLLLPGTTLVASETDAGPQPACERCLNSLLEELGAYKERLGRVPERQKLEKGTHQQLHPAVIIDAQAVAAAMQASDYPAFRTALLPYEEGLRKLVGRWVQRYPDFEAQIGRRVAIADLVEDVFLLAFEGYERRPADVPLGTWLEGLIDPALKQLQRDRDAELENIAMARSARAAVQDRNNL
jgi:hypothetical protein